MRPITNRRILDHPALGEFLDEREAGNGLWFYLKKGYCNHSEGRNGNSCSHDHRSCRHSLREDTATELLKVLKHIGACDCQICKGDQS